MSRATSVLHDDLCVCGFTEQLKEKEARKKAKAIELARKRLLADKQRTPHKSAEDNGDPASAEKQKGGDTAAAATPNKKPEGGDASKTPQSPAQKRTPHKSTQSQVGVFSVFAPAPWLIRTFVIIECAGGWRL